MSSMKPIKKKSTEVQATEAIRSGIIAGEMASGERLTEISLSSKLEVSRATVRTALHQLSQEGLVVQVPYTGWAVAKLSARDCWELFSVRSVLEALGARLAATDITSGGRAILKERLTILETACQRDEAKEIAEADFDLHKCIIELSNNGRLIEQYRLVEQQVRRYIASSDALITKREVIIQQHRPIVDAIIGGDDANAFKLAEAHNLIEGRVLADHLKSLEC